MAEILQTIGSVTGISLVLAVIISLAEKWLNNYGQVNIDINRGGRTFTTEGGRSLLSTLSEQKIFIPSACGGKATCGLCKVQVLSGSGVILPTEIPYLTAQEQKDNVRLSCQVKVKNDMAILIPEELFNIKEFVGTVEELRDETHDIKLLRIRLPEGETVKFKAGQFMQFYTKPYGKVKETVFRAYSIASPPSDNTHIDLIVRLVPGGLATGYVHQALQVGDEVRLSGPYGDFYLRGENADELIMIAGGSGLAPIRSLIYDITEKGLDHKIRFFFGAVARRDLYALEEMAQLEKQNPNFTFIPALSNPADGDEWEGETGRITDVVARHLDGAEGKEAYLCGSPGMLDACIAVLNSKGFSDDSIFYDKF
ncbi:MAG TPA: 2Fe-2S iron-sulfur cluster binding domain-containing protein [Clostridiaceae bacterium]|jgi:Na+-transporting NADH:ubiquinone oxidoreductase subunit F|nr:2Fe-2S iron-sulfur cluster binding domain-containing protein [Clostridiaceae bacterium]